MTEQEREYPVPRHPAGGGVACGRRIHGVLPWAVVIVPMLCLYAAALWWSPLNQDEGWYLHAARRVAEGARPYADFAFTQGPVFPRVYALFDPLVRAAGLAGGRAVTAMFGLLSVLLASYLAMPLAGGGPARRRTAALCTALLCGWNVYQAMFTTVVKTYGLCAVFFTGGVAALAAVRKRRRPVLSAAVSGALLALAAGTRSSAAVALPVAFGWMWRDAADRRAKWAFLLAAAAVSLAAWLPSVAAAPQGVWFATVAYHAGRESGGFLSGLVYRAGSVSRLAGAYLPALLLAALPALCGGRNAGPREMPTGPLWLMLAAAVGIHMAAPVPYDDYQVYLFPVFAALAAAGFVRVAERRAPAEARPGGPGPYRAGVLPVAVALLTGLHGLGSPVLQDWAVAGRDRIWWHVRARSDLAELRRVAAWLEETFPEGPILTQDTYLAVETGRAVPAGLEMGPFSYHPHLGDETAARLRLLNRAGMERLLQTSDAPVAAVSGYGLSIESPGITEIPQDDQARLRGLLHARYEPVRSFPGFGQARTRLDVYRLRPEDGSDPGAQP